MCRRLICLVSFVLVLGLAAGVAKAAPYQQDPGPDGIVSIEAEHYDNVVNKPPDNWWELVTSVPGFTGVFSGTGAMQCMPATLLGGRSYDTNYAANSPRLDYEINFVKTGTHYVWILAYGMDGNSDTCHAGLDGEETPLSNRLDGWNNNYRWRNTRYERPERAQIEITTPGLHVLNIWIREDGLAIDKIVLTTNPNFTLTGRVPGPPESSRWSGLTAFRPVPIDGATDVRHDVVLIWTPGIYADKHDIYLGTNFNDVNDASRTNPRGVLVNQNQDPNSYSPAKVLQWEQTYYWRVDEVNAPPDFTIFKSGIWQFKVEPFAYPIAGANIIATASSSRSAAEGPEKTINSSGLAANDLHSAGNTDMWVSSTTGTQPTWIQYEFDQVYTLHQMWVWNYNISLEPVLGFGVKDATIEYSTDGANWATLGTTHEFARGSGAAGYAHNTTVDLSDVVAKYIKITANSNWGGILNQYGLSEVRFFYVPVLAREPAPASGATDVGVDNVTLSWRAGREAAKHNVYFSTKPRAVINDTSLVATVSGTSYDTGPLELGQTYYWKVNEVNEAETPTTWQGGLWDFSTRAYLVVDGFEDYNDFEPHRIFDTWIDGWNVPANGSQVGYATPPFAERSIIHGGKQSMPLSYDNSTASYSEAAANVANLAIGQDWTKYGIKLLTLWFYGDPNNSATEKMYVKLNGSKVVYDGDASNLTRAGWQPWNIGLSSFGVNLRNVTTLSIGLERSGAVGGKGVVYFDDIWLYPSRCMPELVKPAADLNNDCQVNYLDLEILASEWLLELVNAADVAEILREAESADTMTAPLQILDRADASGGKYVAVVPGNNSSSNPPANGRATYVFQVKGGVYKIIARVIAPSGSDDSFWLRIQGATTQTTNHASGWVRWGVQNGSSWHWAEVQSMDDGGQTVHFTMAAGTYTMELAYREDGTLLDSFLITDNLGLDQRALLPDGVSSDLNDDKKVDFKDYAILADMWLEEQLWP